jgi:hypothetical protein
LKQQYCQYLIYQCFLSLNDLEVQLYLAIGQKIYEDFFQKVAIQYIIKKYKILLLVINLDQEEIIQWIS